MYAVPSFFSFFFSPIHKVPRGLLQDERSDVFGEVHERSDVFGEVHERRRSVDLLT